MRLRILFCACVAAAIFASGCGDDEDSDESDSAEATGSVATAAGPDPAEARAVLTGIVNRAIDDPSYSSSGYLTDPEISQSFLDQLAALEAANTKAGFPGRDFDPFVCAQQLPTGADFAESGGAGDRLTFVGRLRFGPMTEKVTYVMAFNGESWQLDSTECLDAAQPKGE